VVLSLLEYFRILHGLLDLLGLLDYKLLLIYLLEHVNWKAIFFQFLFQYKSLSLVINNLLMEQL